MAEKLTKKAALEAGNLFDRTADLTMDLAKAGHLNPEIAKKFAYQCDLLADHLAKSAGVDITKLASADKAALTGEPDLNSGSRETPEQIGEEKSGPKEQDADESYMDQHFSQQENRELRESQEEGKIGPDKTKQERDTPRAGIQASEVLEHGSKLASLYLSLNKAAARCASSEDAEVKGFGTKLASTGLGILQFQTRLLEGSETDDRIASITRAAGHLLPHIAEDVIPASVPTLTRMAEVLGRLTQND